MSEYWAGKLQILCSARGMTSWKPALKLAASGGYRLEQFQRRCVGEDVVEGYDFQSCRYAVAH
jgi:hypothetical protein